MPKKITTMGPIQTNRRIQRYTNKVYCKFLYFHYYDLEPIINLHEQIWDGNRLGQLLGH